MFLPGYMLLRAMQAQQALGFWEKLTLSLALSIALVGLAGLVLNWTPWGLQAGSWAVLLGGLILLLGIVAGLRHFHLAWPSWPGLRKGPIVCATLATLITVGALGMAVVSAKSEPTPGFTQLWIQADSTPTATTGTVRIGVQSAERTAMQYRLVVTQGGAHAGECPIIELQPGQAWEGTITLPADAGDGKIEALLYRLDDPQTIYRHVSLPAGGQ